MARKEDEVTINLDDIKTTANSDLKAVNDAIITAAPSITSPFQWTSLAPTHTLPPIHLHIPNPLEETWQVVVKPTPGKDGYAPHWANEPMVDFDGWPVNDHTLTLSHYTNRYYITADPQPPKASAYYILSTWLVPLHPTFTLHHHTYSLKDIKKTAFESDTFYIYTNAWYPINTLIPNDGALPPSTWQRAVRIITTYASIIGYIEPFNWTPTYPVVKPLPTTPQSPPVYTYHCSTCCHPPYSCTHSCVCCCSDTHITTPTQYLDYLLTKDPTHETIANLLYITGSTGDVYGYRRTTLHSPYYIIPAIANTYALQHCAHEGLSPEVVSPALKSAVKDLSQTLLDYITMACLGEARHSNVVRNRDTSTNPLFHAMVLVGSKLDRESTWAATPYLDTLWGRAQTLAHLKDLFHSLDWGGGSYGGPAWGLIAERAHEFTIGSLTPMLFIDTIVNVVHNGGWAFNKYYNSEVNCCSLHHYNTLKVILDAKANNATTLRNLICLGEPAASLLKPTPIDDSLREAAMTKLADLRQRRRVLS